MHRHQRHRHAKAKELVIHLIARDGKGCQVEWLLHVNRVTPTVPIVYGTLTKWVLWLLVLTSVNRYG